MCHIRSSFVAIIAGLILGCQIGNAQHLKVSDNGRFLVEHDGRPFFYLGDTAWELFHRLDTAQSAKYLEDRAFKGFTVIQAVILAQLDGLSQPNANGDLPLIDGDPTRPNEAYFAHVDAIVKKAATLGLVIGMLPTWGSYWATDGDTKIFTPASAESFGLYLGKRYKDQPIIWILGGDENINNQSERAIIEGMVNGIKMGDLGSHLMTFHPRGPGFSSDYFHQADWLDFNMYQSSHGAHDHDNGLFADHDYDLRPIKPTLDGEPRYELIPNGFYYSGYNRLDLFDDYDSRQAAYWSILAGACGHTYGHNSIWQMWTSDHKPVLNAKIPWDEAIHHPGSLQMKYLKNLFESRPFSQLVPAQYILLNSPSSGAAKIRAAIDRDGQFAIIYSPTGENFTVDRSHLQVQKLREIWYDTRYGISHVIHSGNTKGIQTYDPPTSGRGNDWILILDNAEANLPLPGSP